MNSKPSYQVLEKETKHDWGTLARFNKATIKRGPNLIKMKREIKSNSNFAKGKQIENTRINELIGFLEKMTCTGNLNQKIPVLPNDDPLAKLFAAVAANQEDLREIDKCRSEAHGELKKIISEKDEALKSLADNELVMLSMLEDVKAQETETKKANEQLEASEEKYRSIVDNMIDGYYRSDKEGNAILISPSVVKILGFSEDEIIGKNIASFYANPNERSAFLKAIKKTGSVENFPAEFKRKDSDNIFIETNSRMYYDKNGDYAGVEGTFHDVTGRIEADKQITKLSQVVKTTSQSVIITDIKGNILFVNEALIKTGGFDNENEIIGRSIYAFTDGQGITKLKEEILPNIFEKGFYYGELQLIKKDNTIFPAEINGSIINDEAGKPELIVAMFSDISGRKQIEQKIREESDNFNKAFYHNDQAFSQMENGVFIDCNDALCKLLNAKNKTHILNTHPSVLSPEMQPDGQTSFEKANKMIEIAFEKGFNRFEWVHKKITGEEFPVEVSLTHIKKDKKDVLHCLWNDISIRKQAEKDLIAAKEKAEESNRLKTAFLNNMSHEIRTPLNGITGFLELLQDPNLEAANKQGYIDIINKSSDRLIATVTDIMEISKIEAGLIEVSVEEVPVNEILNELHGYFSLGAKNKGLKLMQEPSLSDDEAIVLTDNRKLNEILTNLVKNAIKFTDKGSVVFGYNITTDSESNQLIQFFVKDTGIGIPKERQQAIFNHFEQADIEDKKVFEGSGLGLAIAKSYVKMLGGKIWLKTGEGAGSEFIFTIPYKRKTDIANKKT